MAAATHLVDDIEVNIGSCESIYDILHHLIRNADSIADNLTYLQAPFTSLGISSVSNQACEDVFSFFGWISKGSQTFDFVIKSPSKHSKSTSTNFKPTQEKYRSLLHSILVALVFAVNPNGERVLVQARRSSSSKPSFEFSEFRNVFSVSNPFGIVNADLISNICNIMGLDLFQYRDDLSHGKRDLMCLHEPLVSFLRSKVPSLKHSSYTLSKSTSSNIPLSPTNKPHTTQSRIIETLGSESMFTIQNQTQSLVSMIQLYNSEEKSGSSISPQQFLNMSTSQRKPIIDFLKKRFENKAFGGTATERQNFASEWIQQAWTRTSVLIPVSNLSEVKASLLTSIIPELCEFPDRDLLVLIDALNTVFRVDCSGIVISQFTESTKCPLAAAIDHWIPLAKGGLTVPENCVILQWRINGKKSGKLPQFIDFEALAEDILSKSPSTIDDERKHEAIRENDEDKSDDEVNEEVDFKEPSTSKSNTSSSASTFMVYDRHRLLHALCESSPVCLLGFPATLNTRAMKSPWNHQVVHALQVIEAYFAPIVISRLSSKTIQAAKFGYDESMPILARNSRLPHQMHRTFQRESSSFQSFEKWTDDDSFVAQCLTFFSYCFPCTQNSNAAQV